MLHTFKGSARMAGAMRLGELAHRMEARLGTHETPPAATPALFEALDADLDDIAFLLDGLRSTPPELLKLMRSMGASRLRTLRSVELPASLPSLFSGLKIAATVSVIGAVFGEWAGADEGLGRLVLLGNNQLQTPRVYAGIVILTLMAVGLFALAALAERVAVPWNRKDLPA